MLVTHDMATVQELLRPGDAPPRRRAALPRRSRGGGAALLPAQLRRRAAPRHDGGGVPDVNVRVVDAWLENARGRAGRERRAGRADRPRASCSRRATTSRRRCSASTSLDADGAPVFGFNRSRSERRARPDRRRAGACGSRARIENPLLPGRYFVSCLISRNRDAGRPRAARRAAARLRRLRHAARAGQRVGRRRRGRRVEPSRDERRRSALELRDVRGPSALGGGWRRALELLYLIAVTEFRRTLPRARRSATCGRWPGRCCCSACCWPCSRRPSTSATGCRTTRCCCCSTSCSSASSRRRRRRRCTLDRQPGGDRPQDAVPAARDPARGRADERCSTWA